MKNVFVVTHTQSIHHSENRVGGWYDTGLTDKGLADAGIIADHLKALIGNGTAEVFTSDLKRASMTAAPIAARLGVKPVVMSALREISYGEAEGQPQAWLDARYTPAPDDNRMDFDVGIKGAETRRDVASRIYPCVEAIIVRPCEYQIIVTHGFALTYVIAAWMKLPIDATGLLAFRAPAGSVTHLSQDDFWRNRAVLRLADTGHFTGS